MSSDLTRVLHVLEKSDFNLNVFFFFMKELIRGAILSQNHWRIQGVAEGTHAPLIKMPPMKTIRQKSVGFFIFSFF